MKPQKSHAAWLGLPAVSPHAVQRLFPIALAFPRCICMANKRRMPPLQKRGVLCVALVGVFPAKGMAVAVLGGRTSIALQQPRACHVL